MADLSHYPKTEKFQIIDLLCVPHPFCITHHHVAYTADNFGGMLSSSAIEAYEKKTGRPSCGVKGCKLSYKQHEQALLVEVDDERDLNSIPELQEYLLECTPICEKDKYAGFAFTKKGK
jgi:hypothetical protein